MVGSTGLLAVLLLTSSPPGPQLEAADGFSFGDPGTAGFAGAWTGEEFTPAPPEERKAVEPAAFVDAYGREMARSMFQDPLPAPRGGSPFIEELPEDSPSPLQPIPAPPPGESPAPSARDPRDPAYENGLPSPLPPPPPPEAPGKQSPPIDTAPPADEPLGSEACQPGRGPCEPVCDGTAPAPRSLSDWLWGIQFRGWIAQGSTWNFDDPNSNFPVGFNDEANAYQLNQLYTILERPVRTCGFGWDFGGRVDLLYGTDQRFAVARGLETHGDFSPKWNSERYGLAMPQLYAEAYAPVLSGINVKLGHFYTIIGYEVVPAPENFFYSHTYTMLYGEPFTHTGALASTRLGGFTVHGGLTRGWDNWEDNNNDLAFLGGVQWTSPDKQTSLAFAYHGGRERDEPPPNTDFRSLFSLVAQRQVNPWCQYVVQYDHGYEHDGVRENVDAEWHGLAQYLFCTINPRWRAGLRFEWFRDEDGTRVDPIRIGPADFFAVTAGLNYVPNERVVVRPSFRWDWTTTDGRRPFIDFTETDQITLATDFIVKF